MKIIASICFLSAGVVLADVSVPPLFTDHAVLQSGMAVSIWGKADPGETVTVSYLDQKQTASARPDGNWMVKLNSMKPGQAGELVIAGKNTIRLSDVVTGEVWLCSGQSNMAFPMARVLNAKDEMAAATDPGIRQYFVPVHFSQKPMEPVKSAWIPSSPQTVDKFTAVGYFFARDLHAALKVPVGIINCSKGGSPVQAWISEEALADPKFASMQARWQLIDSSYSAERAAYLKDLAAWKAKQPQPDPKSAPKPPAYPAESFQSVGFFGGMLSGLMPYAIRGAVWYQGEANVASASEYKDLLEAMIADWRQHWGLGEFPFILVQLPKYGAPGNDKTDWAQLRDAQRQALATSHTAMAVTIDLGDGKLHPPDKKEFGRRLSLLVRNKVYGEALACGGPLYVSSAGEGKAIRLTFDGKLGSRENQPLAGFLIAGADKKFYPADARIEGDNVWVSSSAVSAPVAVRYAWGNNPADANLTNGEGLPASPFRTDTW